MSQAAWSVCMSALVTRMCTAKATDPIEMPFWELTLVGPKNHLLHGVEISHGKGQFWGVI